MYSLSKNGNNSKDGKLVVKEVYHHQKKRTRESGGEIIGSGKSCKAQRADEVKADKERRSLQARIYEYRRFTNCFGFKRGGIDKKFPCKRQKLYHQQLKIGEEISSCDKSIQRILDGRKDSLALKLETVLDFCDETCLKDRAAIQEDSHQPVEEFILIQPMSGRKLYKAARTP